MPRFTQSTDRTEEGQIELIQGTAKEARRLAHRLPSAERIAFVDGLLRELAVLSGEHLERVQEMADLQARLDIGERNLIATRDYVNTVLSNTKEDVPNDWRELIASLEFLGMRLGDAALEVLRRSKHPLTPEEIESDLNDGQFRFRTGSPRREIHGALLRQPLVRRNDDDTWEYVEPAQDGESEKSREVRPLRKRTA